MSVMKDAQIFITCTDRDMTAKELATMESAEKARYYHVTGGTVSAG